LKIRRRKEAVATSVEKKKKLRSFVSHRKRKELISIQALRKKALKGGDAVQRSWLGGFIWCLNSPQGRYGKKRGNVVA